MPRLFIIALLIIGSRSSVLEYSFEEPESLDIQLQQWELYKAEFGKYYEGEKEDAQRMKQYVETSKLIEDHNQQFAAGLQTFEVGHNQFSDMTEEEANFENDQPVEDFYDDDRLDEFHQEDFVDLNMTVPIEVDWRQRGAVTPVKNGTKCDASWAFAATGALEGQLFRKMHYIAPLSEQNLVDCSTKLGNNGCGQGEVAKALRYIMQNKGVNFEKDYGWKNKENSRCLYHRHPTDPRIYGIVRVKGGREQTLSIALATIGPVAVAVDARSSLFKFYKSGVYNDKSCNPHTLTREMVVVGYGRDHWIVKNSWGTKWGQKGYIYMAKDRGNQCGIATRPVYPVVLRSNL